MKVITFEEAAAYAQRGWLVSAGPGTPNPFIGGLNAVNIVINCQVMASFTRDTPR